MLEEKASFEYLFVGETSPQEVWGLLEEQGYHSLRVEASIRVDIRQSYYLLWTQREIDQKTVEKLKKKGVAFYKRL